MRWFDILVCVCVSVCKYSPVALDPKFLHQCHILLVEVVMVAGDITCVCVCVFCCKWVFDEIKPVYNIDRTT
jgi:hypothetical protein